MFLHDVVYSVEAKGRSILWREPKSKSASRFGFPLFLPTNIVAASSHARRTRSGSLDRALAPRIPLRKRSLPFPPFLY